MTVTENPRRNAFQSLIAIETKDRYSSLEIDSVIKCGKMTPSDVGLYTRLVYGVIEKKLTLDYIISQFSSRKIDDVDRETLTCIRLGAYQILYLDRIPDSAAVNESVNIASKVCPRTKGYVNAVLREMCRRKSDIRMPTKELGDIGYLSRRYSVSEQIVSLLLADYGMEKCEKILSSLSAEAGTTLRVNTLLKTREELINSIKEDGFAADKTANSPTGVRINCNLNLLTAFSRGECFVQDEASQICVAALDAKRGDLLIDVCSCPGGKSFGAAIDMQNKGRVYSFDLHENKLSLVEKEGKKLGISIIETEKRDGREPREELIGKADKIICDVPCSGLGVLAKKPEMRYKDIGMSASLPEIQFAILKASAEYLKKGGDLVYSTCTLLKRENEEVTDRFIRENSDFEAVDFKVGGIESKDGRITLTPDEHSCDGFYICKLRKK